MNTTWLQDRLREALQRDPEASIADGFGYALACIERDETKDHMAEPLLDRNLKYVVRAPDECWWHFVWECDTDADGSHWFWRAYRKRPGQTKFFSVGVWQELEVLQRLTEFSYELDDDDRIDLMNFLYRGGIEAFLKKK